MLSWLASVLGLYKAGNRKYPGNYRPIASCLASVKSLKTVVEIQLQEYLDWFDLLDLSQIGIWMGVSTEHVIHSVVKFIHNSFNKGKFSFRVFIDIQKAFDSANRDILLDKLTFYGILGIEWQRLEVFLRIWNNF